MNPDGMKKVRNTYKAPKRTTLYASQNEGLAVRILTALRAQYGHISFVFDTMGQNYSVVSLGRVNSNALEGFIDGFLYAVNYVLDE